MSAWPPASVWQGGVRVGRVRWHTRSVSVVDIAAWWRGGRCRTRRDALRSCSAPARRVHAGGTWATGVRCHWVPVRRAAVAWWGGDCRRVPVCCVGVDSPVCVPGVRPSQAQVRVRARQRVGGCGALGVVLCPRCAPLHPVRSASSTVPCRASCGGRSPSAGAPRYPVVVLLPDVV